MKKRKRGAKKSRLEVLSQRLILLLTALLCGALLLPSARDILQERGRILADRPLDFPTPPLGDSTYQPLSFKRLGSAELPDDEGWKGTVIPPAIGALHGRPIALAGFMLPLTFEGSQVTSFLLVKDQMACCFGVGTTVKDWVFVKMADPTDSLLDSPVEVRGTFYASPDIADGELLSLYRMRGESVRRKDD